MVHERFPISRIAQVDAQVAWIWRDAGAYVHAVAPASILHGARREHDVSEGAQAFATRQAVQRQLRTAGTAGTNVEPVARTVTVAELVVDQQLTAALQQVDAIGPQGDGQAADLVLLGRLGELNGKRRPQFLLPQQSNDETRKTGDLQQREP
jgi:hypothetical protein